MICCGIDCQQPLTAVYFFRVIESAYLRQPDTAEETANRKKAGYAWQVGIVTGNAGTYSPLVLEF